MKQAPIDTILKPIHRFLKIESIGGFLLFLSAGIAMIWANSPYKDSYHHLWENYFTIRIANFEVSKTFHHWIND
jgi:Na+:H+ antiporter, NhaA family